MRQLETREVRRSTVCLSRVATCLHPNRRTSGVSRRDRTRKRLKLWRANNKEAIAAYQAKYYRNNKKKIKAASRDWRRRNSTRFKAYSNRWRIKNRDIVLCHQRAWRRRNRELLRFYAYFRWASMDPKQRAASVAKQRRYRLKAWGDVLPAYLGWRRLKEAIRDQKHRGS